MLLMLVLFKRGVQLQKTRRVRTTVQSMSLTPLGPGMAFRVHRKDQFLEVSQKTTHAIFDSTVFFHKGLFEDTLPQFSARNSAAAPGSLACGC